MADNIRDVYSIVFESLGEQKLVQDLNKINAALLQEKKLLNDIGNLPGLDKTVDKSAKALKSALNTINARLQAEKKASLDRLKMIDAEEKIERKEEAIKNRKLAFVQKVISQELALYRQLEVEKAKIMAKYGQLPASLQSLKAPLPPKYTFEGATNIRQKNIPNYRQAMQDAKLFVVEQNKLKQQEAQRLATQRQQAAEANRQLATARQQTAELSKQLSLTTKITNGIVGMKKGLQKLATDSFVFQRMFNSITRTLDEWSKMSVAISQFRSSANFEGMNKQLDETVTRLGHVISKYEMIPAINKAKMLGMDFSGNKLSETLEMTTKVSQMFGMDATKAFGDFTVALSKASPIIMDNIGVLLRLEEAYKMYYETQYKGTLGFNDFEKSLTQAQKRAIYYGEAMRLLQEKTEGVSVKTNEVQSVLMRLKDAWNSLGTDLDENGGLNPLIWALEKIVSLADSVANAFMTIQRGFRSLQYLMPSIFGTPDVGFDSKNASDIYRNRATAMQGIKSSYGQDTLDVVNETYDKMREASVKARRDFEKYVSSLAGTLITDENKKRAAELKKIWQESADLLDYMKKKKSESDKQGLGFISNEDINRMSKFIPEMKQYKDYLDGVAELRKEEANYSQKAGSAFINNNFLDATGNYALSLWKKMRADSEEMSKSIGMHSTDPFFIRSDINSDKLLSSQAAKKQMDELNVKIANNARLDEFNRSEYNTKKEALDNMVKLYLEEYKLTTDQVKLAEMKKKTGALYAISLNDLVVGDKSQLDGDKNFIRETALLKKEFNKNYQAEDDKSRKKMIETYRVKENDLQLHNIAMAGLLNQLPEAMRNNVDVIRKAGEPLKNELWDWLTIGVKDKEELKKRAEAFVPIYQTYLELVQAGATIGLKNNIFAPFTKNIRKESGTGRSKAPKEFWDKWYEMNRTAFTETLPEGITRDIEQARLDWFDQVKNLENLKKDILQAKEQGRLDPEERKKFFGESGNDPKVFENQMKAFRDTIENNYSRMLDKMSKELQERLNEINPFQQFAKDAKLRQLEERGKYLSENPAQGGIASWNIGNKNSAVLKAEQYDKLKTIQIDINRIKYANGLKTIEKEKSAIQEEARKNIQAQTQLEIANLEAFKQGDKEWKNTAEFKEKKEAILKKYADMELLAMQDINNQYAERKKWTANILLDNSLTLGFLNKEREAVEKIAKTMADWNRQKNQYRAEDERLKSKFANENPDITAYGFNAMGFGETEESMAMKMGGAGEKVFNDLMKSRFSSLKMFMQTFKTDTAFNFQLGGANFELLGDEEKERLRAEADAMTNIFTDALDAIKKAVGDASGFWKQALAEMFSGVANFAGNMAWNAITGEDVSGVQALREARKTDLKDQQEQLKNKSITQETYAKRAYEIEKTYIENKKAAEKNYRNEQWKQLGAVFWAQGMGYMIKGGIDMFINPTAGQAELTGGAALMALGAMLGYGRGGKKAMSKANMAEESKATKQDINVYVDNKIFEDKRQLKQAINNASV